jgi:hypothetical protein
MMKDHHKSEQSQWREQRCRTILDSILADSLDSSLLLEFFYWTREPGMRDIIRGIAALPEEARSALEAFFAMSHEPGAVVAKWDAAGRLTLASPQVGHTMAILQYCAEHEDAEAPPIPN